jgi:hypothetical protein
MLPDAFALMQKEAGFAPKLVLLPPLLPDFPSVMLLYCC